MKFLLSFLILVSSIIQAQNIIKFEKNNKDAELSKIIFIDTTTNEIVTTFSPAEKCPYWNLPYKRINEEGDYNTVRYFDLKDIDSLTKDEIPGLVNIAEWGRPLLKPYDAYTSNSAHVSNNNQWVIISSYIAISDFSDDENDGEFEAYAKCLQIYDSEGNLFRKLLTDEVDMDDAGITDDGQFLFYDYRILRNCFLNYHSSKNPGLRVINLKTMDIELDIPDYDTNMVYLYPYVAGDYICIFSETRGDYEDVDTRGCNTAVCYNFKKNVKYTGYIDPSFKDYCNIVDLTEEGIYFQDWSVKDATPVLYRFNKDFKKEKIN